MRGVPYGKRLLMMVACLLGIVGLLCAATTASANAKHYANDYALTAIDNNAMPASEVAAVESAVCVREANMANNSTRYVIVRQQRQREASCERQARRIRPARTAIHATASLFRRGVTIAGR